MDNNFKSDILHICRTCMKEITDTSFLYLDCTSAANTQLTIRQKLHNCIPELDLSIVFNAIICSKCVDYLFSAYEFKKNCLQSEIQINKYIQGVQHAGEVNLVEVVQFQFQQLDLKTEDVEIKMEDLEIMEDFKNEDLVCHCSVFNEASKCTEPTELKYLLELQKVDIDDVLFNTFEDYNINYNLSAAEEENSVTHSSSIAQNCLSEVTDHQNEINAYYQCYKCGYKTESKLNLILHLKHHTRKNFHYREIISKRLSKIHLTKKEYKHILKHTDVHIKSFHPTIKVNKTHIKGNIRKCIKNCNNDNESFKNRNKSKESKQHFSHRSSIKLNMRLKKRVRVEKLFKCSRCEYQCNCKVTFKRHVLIHTGEKPFSCSICDYRCNFISKLKRHMLIHTGEKPFSCFVCEYQCSQKSALKEHIRVHTGENQFLCSICEYQCNRKSTLMKHIRIHTGEKPFVCSVCEYRCSWKQSLNRHMRIHTGEKPFSCSICKYKCSRKLNLKMHMLIHTEEKPFSCSVCKYQCKQKRILNRHMLIHTGDKPFSCSACKYQCRRKEYLKLHMRIHT